MKSTAYRPPMPAELMELVIDEDGDRLNAVFKSAYAAGWTLQELADVRGVSREAIRLRTVRPVPSELLAEMDKRMPPKPRKPGPPPRQLKPIELVPPSVLETLAALQVASSGTTGMTPLGDPKRTAGDELCKLAAGVMETYGVPISALSKALGLSTHTLRARLAGRGYIKGSPSYRKYLNVTMQHGRHRKTNCLRGHKREGNTTTQGHCRTCMNEQAKGRYKKSKENAS